MSTDFSNVAEEAAGLAITVVGALIVSRILSPVVNRWLDRRNKDKHEIETA